MEPPCAKTKVDDEREYATVAPRQQRFPFPALEGGAHRELSACLERAVLDFLGARDVCQLAETARGPALAVAEHLRVARVLRIDGCANRLPPVSLAHRCPSLRVLRVVDELSEGMQVALEPLIRTHAAHFACLQSDHCPYLRASVFSLLLVCPRLEELRFRTVGDPNAEARNPVPPLLLGSHLRHLTIPQQYPDLSTLLQTDAALETLRWATEVPLNLAKLLQAGSLRGLRELTLCHLEDRKFGQGFFGELGEALGSLSQLEAFRIESGVINLPDETHVRMTQPWRLRAMHDFVWQCSHCPPQLQAPQLRRFGCDTAFRACAWCLPPNLADFPLVDDISISDPRQLDRWVRDDGLRRWGDSVQSLTLFTWGSCTSATLETITRMTQLRRLALRCSNELHPDSVSRLRSALPHLESAEISTR